MELRILQPLPLMARIRRMPHIQLRNTLRLFLWSVIHVLSCLPHDIKKPLFLGWSESTATA